MRNTLAVILGSVLALAGTAQAGRFAGGHAGGRAGGGHVAARGGLEHRGGFAARGGFEHRGGFEARGGFEHRGWRGHDVGARGGFVGYDPGYVAPTYDYGDPGYVDPGYVDAGYVGPRYGRIYPHRAWHRGFARAHFRR